MGAEETERSGLAREQHAGRSSLRRLGGDEHDVRLWRRYHARTEIFHLSLRRRMRREKDEEHAGGKQSEDRMSSHDRGNAGAAKLAVCFSKRQGVVR